MTVSAVDRGARDRVAEAGGRELADRLAALDRIFGSETRPDRTLVAPDVEAKPDVDVLLVGGGLSLLLAPLLARRGLSVAVADRGTVGAVHREWNGSHAELGALARAGLFTADELDGFVVARYREGVCRWAGGGVYPVSGVLDHAIDAHPLLARARVLAEEAGVRIFDRHSLEGVGFGRASLRAALEAREGSKTTVLARVVVDARGAASPYATADIVCPTVGGVFDGFVEGDAPDEVNRAVGDILVTTEGIAEGHQHIWEGFPGRGAETTVYSFYYARRSDLRRGALTALYDRFFRELPRYKRGSARLLRPTFGLIPGWSRLTPPPSSPSPRWLLVGDAAARHSPLTFCGFGSMVRHLEGTASRIEAAVEGRVTAIDEEAIHAGTGLLSLLLATPSGDPRRAGSLNALLDAAFGALHERGDAFYGALLRDELPLGEMIGFLYGTSRRRPQVYADVLREARPVEVARWSQILLRGFVAGRR